MPSLHRKFDCDFDEGVAALINGLENDFLQSCWPLVSAEIEKVEVDANEITGRLKGLTSSRTYPIIALEQTGGWAQRLAGSYLDDRKRVCIQCAESPQESADMAMQFAAENGGSTRP